MPSSTQLFQQLPWMGGVNTSIDDSLIPPNQLVRADNVTFDTTGARKPRDGIKYNWDNQTVGTDSIYGLHEFWYGMSSRQRHILSINSARKVRYYNSGGVATDLTLNGQPWTGTTDEPSMLTFNNRAFFAVNGTDNLIKHWDGDVLTQAEDLRNIYNLHLVAAGRSSAGTTRTLKFTQGFFGDVGDFIVVSSATGLNAAFYNGTVQVLTITTTTFPNDTITYTGPGGVLAEAATTDAALTVDGTAPLGSILREHVGRIWTNDKTNRDRLHFCGSFNHTQWFGFGDSGALDIGIGDGDSVGITAIFPSFKGDLFVAKQTKLYRVRGYTPESFSIELVSSGVGCLNNNAVTLVDQDDCYFVSEKGVHSLAATANYGDFGGAFLSTDIQKTFNNSFTKSKLKYCKVAYNPEINSVAFCFTDSNIPVPMNTTLGVNNSVWLYNTIFKGWYRHLDVPCQALLTATDGGKKRYYFGTHTDKVIKSATGAHYDINYDGDKVGITSTVETGQISLDGNFYNQKGIKRFILYYKPEGPSGVQVTIKVDGIPLDATNSPFFSEQASGTLLGVNFILGESVLGSDAILAPYTRTIDGYGRSVKIKIVQSGINQFAEIQGFGIEWEPAGTSPEAVSTF